MKIRLNISAAVCILLNGCYGYVGGFDDADTQFSELVLINRSTHDIELRIPTSKWSEDPDTIILEKGNGLWKRDFDFDHTYSNVFFDEVEITVDGKERFLFDDFQSVPYNPCSTQYMKNLNDSKGIYYVYEFNETAYEACKKYFDDLKAFTMNDVPPSYIVKDTLVTAGSSEALLRTIYPGAGIRERLRLGAVVGKEAESVGKIRFFDDDGTAQGRIEISERESIGGRKDKPCMVYYDINELRKTGLAHFGCDFAELTGRSELDRYCGCMYTILHIKRRETLHESPETAGYLMSLTLDKAFVNQITYGTVKILLAEADCLDSRLQNHLYFNVLTDYGNDNYFVPDIRFHLIDLDKNGDFRCKSGGMEIVEMFLDESDTGTNVPIDFAVYDNSGNTYIHVQDIP